MARRGEWDHFYDKGEILEEVSETVGIQANDEAADCPLQHFWSDSCLAQGISGKFLFPTCSTIYVND